MSVELPSLVRGSSTAVPVCRYMIAVGLRLVAFVLCFEKRNEAQHEPIRVVRRVPPVELSFTISNSGAIYPYSCCCARLVLSRPQVVTKYQVSHEKVGSCVYIHAGCCPSLATKIRANQLGGSPPDVLIEP